MINYKISKFCITLGLTSLFACGLSIPTASVSQTCDTKNCQSSERRLSLWKIKHHAATVYLLGSVHALTEDQYPLDPTITKAYSTSEKIVFEINLDKLDNDKIATLMKALGSYTRPETVNLHLQPETNILLDKYIAGTGFNKDIFLHLKPWLISLRIGLHELKKLGYESKFGIDQYFQRQAKQDHKQILQLETFSQQIELLASGPAEFQDLVLRDTLINIDEMDRLISELIKAWASGAADKMYALSIQQNAGNQMVERQIAKILDERNINMAIKIREFLEAEGQYLVVVGALHMGGPQGLLALLSEDFNIEQQSPE